MRNAGKADATQISSKKEIKLGGDKDDSDEEHNDEKIAAMSDPELAPNAGLPTIEQAVASGGFLCGTPEMIIESLKKLEHRYPGLERVSVSHPIGTPHSLILDQLEWFATDVIPAFKPIKNTDTPLQ